jgi:hypothetical protein
LNKILDWLLFLKILLCCFLLKFIYKLLFFEMRFYTLIQSLLSSLKTMFLFIRFINSLLLFIFKNCLDIAIFKFRKILANKIYIKDVQFDLCTFDRIWIQIIKIFLRLNRHIIIVAFFIEFNILVILLSNY